MFPDCHGQNKSRTKDQKQHTVNKAMGQYYDKIMTGLCKKEKLSIIVYESNDNVNCSWSVQPGQSEDLSQISWHFHLQHRDLGAHFSLPSKMIKDDFSKSSINVMKNAAICY